jgi:NADH dehydrogenase
VSAARPHIVVVGGGFGGLAAVRGLRDAPVDVTLLDRANHHLFQPLLYQVATGSLSPANVAAPLRGMLRQQRNARVLLAEVLDIDLGRRSLSTDAGELSYDTLVLATGARHDYFGHEWAHLAPGLKTVADATEIRRRILAAFETAEAIGDESEAQEWLTFVVVGGGPTGVELAGALAEIARSTLRQDFRAIDPAHARILLVEGDSQILSTYPKALARRALHALQRLGVTVMLDTRVTGVDEESVLVQRGEQEHRIPARTAVWAAGVRASRLGKLLADRGEAEVDRAGRVTVGPNLMLPGHPEVFVIGDLAHATDSSGRQLPGLASVALQEGRFVAATIAARVAGAAIEDFRYRDRGTMAVVGRGFAIAALPRLHLWGLPGWLVWALFHLGQIMEFENRVLVFVQWTWSYWTRNRSARLIIGRSPTARGAQRDQPPETGTPAAR